MAEVLDEGLIDPGLYDPVSTYEPAMDCSILNLRTIAEPYCKQYRADTYYWYKFGALTVLAIIGIILVYVLGRRAIRYFTRPEMAGMSREQIAKRWAEIRSTSTQGVMGAKLAIMEADTLLDAALKSMMLPGETLGERLKVACYKYPKLREVWPAHKLRNSLAHEATFQISPRQAKQALDDFERALKLLNVL